MDKPNYILGIYAYFHESAACIIKDGKLVAMAEEERFNRKKHTYVFPYKAICFCLKKTGIKLRQVNRITFGFLPSKFLLMQLKSAIVKFPKSLNLLRYGASYMPVSTKVWSMLNLTKTFQQHFGKFVPPIKYIPHHLAHAYSTYWPSSFNDAAILVADGFGEDTATTIFYGHGNSIEKISSLPYYDSLGVFYGAVTQYLGFTPHFDEYKVMGMAAYGKDRYHKIFSEILQDNDPFYKLNPEYIDFYTHGVNQWYSSKFTDLFGPARTHEDPYKQIHFDIACSAQKQIERVALTLGKHIHKVTGSQNLCLAGGVAQNVLMNTLLLNKCGFKNIYIPPIAFDAGCSLGSALAYYHIHYSGKRLFQLNHAGWGPSFSNKECKKSLLKNHLKYNYKKNQSASIAKLLMKGCIIGYFDGAMEIGPRALGNRTILADPRRADVKDILNSRIKKREFFRPFAPIVTEEDAHKYFELSSKSPFMTLVAKVKNPKLLPGITHADGTARIQTVNKKLQPNIYSVLKSFEKLSGVPVLLNTSFNENEPIVCTPDEAINCYLRTKMDVLVFNNQLLCNQK